MEGPALDSSQIVHPQITREKVEDMGINAVS